MEFNRFDVSAKELVWDDPNAWLQRFAIGSGITTLSAAVAREFRAGSPQGIAPLRVG